MVLKLTQPNLHIAHRKRGEQMDPKNPCKNCSACCRHIAVEIDKPTCKDDYDAIYWYLLHEDVNVFVDDESDWFVEFITACKNLDGHRCADYMNRPKICEDYEADGCVKWGEGEPDKIKFTSAQQFIKWLESKGKDWKFQSVKNRVKRMKRA